MIIGLVVGILFFTIGAAQIAGIWGFICSFGAVVVILIIEHSFSKQTNALVEQINELKSKLSIDNQP